jgi:hypothetical protein
MNRLSLVIVLVFAALAVAQAENPILDQFRSLQSADISEQNAAVQNVLTGTDDPGLLLQAADLFQSRCIDPSVNTLEYWGPDAEVQTELRASADLLMRLLDRAETIARSQSDSAAASMRNATDSSQLDRWTRLNEETRKATDEMAVAGYARLLAAEPEEKETLADRAMAAINKLDQSDPKRQYAIHLQKGKILLAADQLKSARAKIALVLVGSAKSDIAQQYQAHYFLCVCDLRANEFTTARSDLADLLAWQNQRLTGDYANLKRGVTAATAILQYRLDCAQADQSDSANEKVRYNQSAVAQLAALVQQQPALKPTILDHLSRRYVVATDIEHADPLVLEALMLRGAANDADSRTLAEANRAAETVLQRGSEFAPATVDYAAALSAAILDKTGQISAAAEAYLALARRLQNRDVKTAGTALDRAIELSQNSQSDKNAREAYAQALTMAVAPPFNRNNLLYAQARLLMERSDYRAAADALRQIPSGDSRHIEAELAQMICIQQLMDSKSQRSRTESADQITTLADDIVKQSTGPSSLAAQAILIEGDTCQSLHEPDRVLECMKNFAAICRGLPDEDNFLDKGMELRIWALVELDRPAEAANLLAGSKDQINAPVATLVKQLDADFDSAKSADESRTLATARVGLAAWLVNHASIDHPDELNRDRLFYADSLRRAGKLETNNDARRAELEKSLDIFRQLTGGDVSESSDATLLLGEAGTEFDLGNYSAARDILIKLLGSGGVGDGQGASADSYWEATYELLASNASLAATGQASAEQQAQTVAYLKRLYIRWGNQIGGKRFHGGFESLRQRLVPDFNPASAASP